MEENKLLKFKGGALQKVGNAISITNKLVANFDKKLAHEYFGKGLSFFVAKQYEEAILNYNKAIELNSSNSVEVAVAYEFRGNAKDALQDYYGAIADFTKSIELRTHPSAYEKRGGAKSLLGDFEGAVYDYNKAIELNPNYAEAYNNRGLVKNKLNDKSGACIDWSKAGELGYVKAYDMIKKHCT